jgi:ABC-type branched-subunit amino acid transport system substrate-binding protein
VQALIDAMDAEGQAPGTGGFVTGAAAIDAIAAAIQQTGGTDGEALADAFEGFDGLDTISGAISFSDQYHSVFGREYRVMEVQNSQPKFVELKAASSPAEIN